MGLVHSVLRPPGTGLQMTTPPAGATRLAFSGGEGILRQQHGPRGAPIKKEQTLLGVNTQVAAKKAPAKGEGARKNPSEMHRIPRHCTGVQLGAPSVLPFFGHFYVLTRTRKARSRGIGSCQSHAP